METKTRYVTLQYPTRNVLIDCNEKITLKGKRASTIRKINPLNVEDEMGAKLDTIVERAETVLEMFPASLRITIVLLADFDAVAAVYNKKYEKHISNIAFYSLSENTIYVSVEDMHNGVLVHEISHAIVNNYFNFRLPYKVHEMMAQFTERHFTD